MDEPTVLDAVGFRPAVLNGRSNALVLTLADGRAAVVKLKGNPQSSRALAGDLVGTCLGRLVGAPFAEPVLVRVATSHLLDIPPLRVLPWMSGLQFGTIYRPGAQPVRPPAAVRGLTNLDGVPVAALVEVWLHNTDLKPSHVLAVPGRAGPELLVCDHGHILPHGPLWTPAHLAESVEQVPDVSALTALARAAGRPFAFGPAVSACANVSDADLARVVGMVPREWGIRAPEAESLYHYLRRRRARLRGWAAELEAIWNR